MWTLLATLVIALLGGSIPAAAQDQRRPMAPEDLFRIERVGSGTWSPDGRMAVVSISRSRDLLDPAVASDLWLVDAERGTTTLLMPGDSSIVGTWFPRWSRDGRYLAFLATDIDGRVGAVVWERGTEQSRRLSNIAVTTTFGDSPLVWLDERRLLVSSWGEGAVIRGEHVFKLTPGRYARELYARAQSPDDAAVTIVQAGGAAAEETASAEIRSVDVLTGAATVLVRGAAHRIRRSPDGRRIAYFKEHPPSHVAPVELFLSDSTLYAPVNWGTQLHVADGFTGRDVIPPVQLADIEYESIRWSDAGELALIATLRGAAGAKREPGILATATGTLREVSTTGLDSLDRGSLRWDGSRLIIRAFGPAGAQERRWWELTGSLPRAVDGPSISVVEAARVPTVAPPAPNAYPVAISPNRDRGVFMRRTDCGTDLLLHDGRVLWSGNHWLREVATGTSRAVKYTGLGGQSLTGWILLPPGKQEPVPFVTIVYPGLELDSSASPFDLLDNTYLNAHLFAALGYGVLIPSMPSVSGLPASLRLDSLTIGVLPVVDSLVAWKVADPERLAIAGLSGGGFSTLGIIANTKRFKAAIAIASYANLASLYGTFYGQHRTGEGGHPQTGQALRILSMERGFGAMRGPPWEHSPDYVAASPLFRVASVDTPVLLVHGDMDFIPIQQAEEYFTALYRRGKPVELVRYHGEGHGLIRKAAVLDLWMRIAAWLERYAQ